MCGLHSKFNERDWYSNLWLRVTAHTRVVTLSCVCYTAIGLCSGVVMRTHRRSRSADAGSVEKKSPEEPSLVAFTMTAGR